MSNRFITTIVCDDVRPEIGNKYSYMGIYGNTLFVPKFPAVLTKLCFVSSASTPITEPFGKLKFRLMKDGELVTEVEIDPAELNQSSPAKAQGEERRMTVSTVLQLVALPLSGPCAFNICAVTENGKLEGETLNVRQGPQ